MNYKSCFSVFGKYFIDLQNLPEIQWFSDFVINLDAMSMHFVHWVVESPSHLQYLHTYKYLNQLSQYISYTVSILLPINVNEYFPILLWGQ